MIESADGVSDLFSSWASRRKSNVLANSCLSRRLGSRDFVSKQNGGSRCLFDERHRAAPARLRRLARAIVATRSRIRAVPREYFPPERQSRDRERKLNSQIPDDGIAELAADFQRDHKEKTGLFRSRGATGSGTNDGLWQRCLNEAESDAGIYIVTLEDPIEFMHPHARPHSANANWGAISRSSHKGLDQLCGRLRGDFGLAEIRDRKRWNRTDRRGWDTLFKHIAHDQRGQSINRILGMFSKDEEQQVRERLAERLRYVVSSG